MRVLSVVLTCAVVLGICSATCAFAADFPPGLMYSTVLNGVKLMHNSGEFRLDSIQAVFLPDPQNNEYYPYNPTGGAALWTIVRKADGTELFRLDWSASLLKNPFWLLESYKSTNIATGEESYSEWMMLPGAGDYVLDFYVEGSHFFTFPFSTSVIASDDPYAGDPYHFIQGDWSDWGYFYYADANPEQSIVFKVWLNNHAYGERSAVPKLEVKRGGTLVCASRPYMTYTLKPQWNRFELDLISPMEGTSGGGYFKAKDLLANDGDYTMTLHLDDELYGTWKFSVKGGKFVTSGRAARGGDPLTFIDGGRDAFWFEKQ